MITPSPTANAQDVTATLDQQLAALVKLHDLSSLSITVYGPGSSNALPTFDACAQGGGQCAHAAFDTRDTVVGKVKSAIDELTKKRHMAAVVGELAALDVAA